LTFVVVSISGKTGYENRQKKVAQNTKRYNLEHGDPGSCKGRTILQLEKGDTHPVKIVIALANSAGIFQVDELLGKKLKNSTLERHVEIVAKIEGETERRLIEVYKL
jgi:metal-dependent HD superfamily phosphatase/phosphodiesterase